MGYLGAAVLTWALHLVPVALLLVPWLWWNRRAGPGRSADDAGPGSGAEPDVRAAGGPARRDTYRLLGIVAVVYLVALVLLMSAPDVAFAGLAWNWQGKLLVLVGGLVLVALWPGLSWREVGLGWSRRGVWRHVIGIVAGAAAISLFVTPLAEPRGSLLETALYQATMPGLQEELLFRGILWALIAQALPGGRTIAGVPVSWSLVVTSLLFGLGHGILVEPGEGLRVEIAPVVLSGLFGLYAGWLRDRAGSIWPLVAMHNAINLAVTDWSGVTFT